MTERLYETEKGNELLLWASAELYYLQAPYAPTPGPRLLMRLPVRIQAIEVYIFLILLIIGATLFPHSLAFPVHLLEGAMNVGDHKWDRFAAMIDPVR